MAADDLRPRTVPRPTAAAAGTLRPDQLPGAGRPPLQQGKVHMTDETRRQLEIVGWKDGDSIPGDLGVRLQELQRELIEERQQATLEGSPLAADWKPVQSSFVKIEDLSPAKQAEIRQYLQEHNAEIAQQRAMAQAQESADAEIPESVQGPQRDLMRDQLLAGDAAMAARQSARSPNESIVIDDRQQTAAPPPDVKVPEGKTYAGSLGQPSVASKIEAANKRQRDFEREQAGSPPPPVTADKPSAGGTPERTVCQRCSWPLAIPFEVVPTIEDKQGFLAAILGMSRFEKQFPLLNGNLVVFFRSLTSDETATIQNQLGAMVRSGALRGDGEYWGCMHEFRMIVSISRIVVGGNTVYAVPSLKEWAAANPPWPNKDVEPTPIPQLKEYFYLKGATQEPVRRMLGQVHQEFQRLVEALEFMSSDPDFWIGIELPA